MRSFTLEAQANPHWHELILCKMQPTFSAHLLPAELYAQSVFCLQPPGDTLARTAIVEV